MAARQLKGEQRRRLMAEACAELCESSPRLAERRFGWGRETVARGLEERDVADKGESEERVETRGRRRSEELFPQLSIDIREIVEPHTQADPELKSARVYTNYSAKEVRAALLNRGYSAEQVPSERTLRDILNRMNYRLKRIQKGRPLKKTAETDAIFANVQAVHEEAAADETTLEISVDTKTKVSLGGYSLGGKKSNR
jgi:hypothetical protein